MNSERDNAPVESVYEVIISRFKAGESIESLCDDYGLTQADLEVVLKEELCADQLEQAGAVDSTLPELWVVVTSKGGLCSPHKTVEDAISISVVRDEEMPDDAPRQVIQYKAHTRKGGGENANN